MNQHQLRELIAAVKAGRVSRRTFVRQMVGLGLTVLLANQLLANAGLAQMAGSSDYKPNKPALQVIDPAMKGEPPMALYELRTYTLYVGKMAEVVKLYQEIGFPALQKFRPLGNDPGGKAAPGSAVGTASVRCQEATTTAALNSLTI